MASTEKIALRYLQQYGEPEAQRAASLRGAWRCVVVIPACAEEDALPATLAHLSRAAPDGGLLIILVINAPEGASAQMIEANARTLAALSKGGSPLAGEGASMTWSRAPRYDLLLIDRSSDGWRLPAKEGVGLARKIGGDLALALWLRGRIEDPWLWSTDADAKVPESYFERSTYTHEQKTDVVALTLPFVHDLSTRSPDEGLCAALLRYECWLRHHTLSLEAAGSPYAFHALGSVIVVRMDAYARVRGFPRKNATEDFYLLNKLAKIGPLIRGAGPPIHLQFRASTRVPVGTGPAMRQIAARRADGEAFEVLHPLCYQALACALPLLNRCVVEAIPRAEAWRTSSVDETLQAWIEEAFEKIGIDRAIDRAQRASKNADVSLRHFHTWFDGMRTARFLHGVRDAGAGTLPWREALELRWGDARQRWSAAQWTQKLFEIETASAPAISGLHAQFFKSISEP